MDEKLANERKLTAEREDLTRDEIRKLKEDVKDKVIVKRHALNEFLSLLGEGVRVLSQFTSAVGQ